ncbi:MAG TPA: amidohydrolase family protein [Bryobacteraceae bacterium]|nr:amidohydrolase family protein [Bryobacteraceae bacterium]
MSELSRRGFLGSAAALAAMPVRAAAYRTIDSHVHPWKHDPEFPFAEGAHPPATDATPEMIMALMKANDVSKTVLIQVIHYRYDNRYLLHVLKSYPGTFQGVCRVDPLDPAAPDQLSKLTEQGIRGVRLSPSGGASGDWFHGPLMPPLWKRCLDLKVPMTVLAPITRMPEVGAHLETLPELTVVIDHMADCPISQPAELEKLIALKRYPNVFVKISHTWSISRQQYPWLDAQEYVKRLYDAYGPQRLMFGTDWPISERNTTYARAVSVVRNDMKFLNDDDKSWIMSKTVQRVWPFPA